jgi:hypothetical protein
MAPQPQAIVPDNLKSAISKASRYEAVLNSSFAAFAAHYHLRFAEGRNKETKKELKTKGSKREEARQ